MSQSCVSRRVPVQRQQRPVKSWFPGLQLQLVTGVAASFAAGVTGSGEGLTFVADAASAALSTAACLVASL